MKFFLLLAFLLLAAPAAAQLDIPGVAVASQKPPLTDARTVAMTYYRFSGQMPNFPAWALLSEEYEKAPAYEKLMTQDRIAKALAQDFSLIAVGDQVVVDLPVRLSEYSVANKGYVIEGIAPGTSFPFEYAGERFAVIPDNLIDRQFLSADGMPAKAIDDLRRASQDGKSAVLTLVLLPRAAPKEAAEDVDGTPVRLIGAEIGGMSFFDAEGRLVWHENPPRPGTGDAARQQELLNLYR